MTNTIQAPRVHINDLHFEHQRWTNEMNFYLQELGFFTSKLEEIASRYTTAEVMAELEHFQNQFRIQHNSVEELRHDIKEHENQLEKYASEHPIAIDHVLFQDHAPLRDKVETNARILQDLKQEFYRFLSKWM